MSELIGNTTNRKALLKELILKIHQGQPLESVRNDLISQLKHIPYDEVVEVEQQLIQEGLPTEEILQFCDLHSAVLEGRIDHNDVDSTQDGHPVDTFTQENIQLRLLTSEIRTLVSAQKNESQTNIKEYLLTLKGKLNQLFDVDKHYLKKEYLLFPFLEKHGISGPPKVMWGKHDQTRALFKDIFEQFKQANQISLGQLPSLLPQILELLDSIESMTTKEEEILFPMSIKTLTEDEWFQIHQQTGEYGYCLYDPQTNWVPESSVVSDISYSSSSSIRLPTGNFSIDELNAFFNMLPMDITFVDKDDKVKFFSLGTERIFSRNKAILGRSVQLCHPPSSVHIVEQILTDFKNGTQSNAAFWIQIQEKMIYIEYIALRSDQGEYLGVLECTQNITRFRELEGEQRLLSYSSANK